MELTDEDVITTAKYLQEQICLYISSMIDGRDDAKDYAWKIGSLACVILKYHDGKE